MGGRGQKAPGAVKNAQKINSMISVDRESENSYSYRTEEKKVIKEANDIAKDYVKEILSKYGKNADGFYDILADYAPIDIDGYYVLENRGEYIPLTTINTVGYPDITKVEIRSTVISIEELDREQRERIGRE